MHISAGDLTRQVYIEQPPAPNVTDAAGQPSKAWTTFAGPCYAKIEPLYGRELIAAQAINTGATTKVSLRYRAGVTAKMRVRYGSRIFQIVAPPLNPDEANEWLVLTCEEGLRT